MKQKQSNQSYWTKATQTTQYNQANRVTEQVRNWPNLRCNWPTIERAERQRRLEFDRRESTIEMVSYCLLSWEAETEREGQWEPERQLNQRVEPETDMEQLLLLLFFLSVMSLQFTIPLWFSTTLLSQVTPLISKHVLHTWKMILVL